MNHTDSLVSIIMPSYLQMEYIPDAIESVMKQTYPNWELLIIDDGSPDGVSDIAREYERKDRRIHFYHTGNHGLAGARNFGLAHARGEFIVALDADDILESTYLEKCLDAFRTLPDLKVAYSRWNFFGASTRTIPLKFKGYRSLLLKNSIFCSAMFRKDDALAIGGYDSAIRIGFEDWEFWIRLINNDSEVYQVPEPLFNYRIKSQSMLVDANKSEKLSKIHLYILTKHLDKYTFHFGAPIDAMRYMEKYDNVPYRRLWKAIKRCLRK